MVKKTDPLDPRFGELNGYIVASIEALDHQPLEPVIQAVELIVETLRGGGKVLLCGNGGSAADAQHIAAELMGRYRMERQPLPAIALTTDTSALTAIANDYGYDCVFERQLVGLGQPGDCLVALSTSGRSPSVLYAMQRAKRREIKVVGLTGNAPDAMFAELCDALIKVASGDTAIIQQCHITIGHMICWLVEQDFVEKASG